MDSPLPNRQWPASDSPACYEAAAVYTSGANLRSRPALLPGLARGNATGGHSAILKKGEQRLSPEFRPIVTPDKAGWPVEAHQPFQDGQHLLMREGPSHLNG